MTLFVQPIHVTNNLDAMSNLLVALRLSAKITTDNDNWAVLPGRGSTLALHSELAHRLTESDHPACERGRRRVEAGRVAVSK